MTSSTAANTSPPADGVKVKPSAVAAAKSNTASAGKIHADRGIGPCALMSVHILKAREWTMRQTDRSRQPFEASMNCRAVSIAP